MNSCYIDIHTHLTHEKFNIDRDLVITRAANAGVKVIVVNGLEPVSNRQILEMATKYEVIKPALGIYPIDAVNHLLPDDFPHRVKKFDVDAEVAFISKVAKAGKLFAIGECGLDAHWIKENTFKEQERIFESLIEVAQSYSLPIIIHTRKLEVRSMEILRHHNVSKVNFHCYGGKPKYAIQAAEQSGWWFSIPANAARSESFTKLLRELPPERILTETDAPYLSPVPGMRNEPANVVGTVNLLARLRGWSPEAAKEKIWENFCELCSIKSL